MVIDLQFHTAVRHQETLSPFDHNDTDSMGKVQIPKGCATLEVCLSYHMVSHHSHFFGKIQAEGLHLRIFVYTQMLAPCTSWTTG